MGDQREVETGSPLAQARSFWIGMLAASILLDCIGWATGRQFFVALASWILGLAIATGIAITTLLVQVWSKTPADYEGWSAAFWQASSGFGCVLLSGLSWSLRPDHEMPPGVLAVSLAIVGLTVALLPLRIGQELLGRGLRLFVGQGYHRPAAADDPPTAWLPRAAERGGSAESTAAPR